MRFYTVEHNKEMYPAVSCDGGASVYLLQDLGLKCKDLNEYICSCGMDHSRLIQALEKNTAKALPSDSYRILAPIPVPLQDVVCLGINYDEHAAEAGRYSEEAFGGERPYTIYFGKRVNRATADGESIPSYEGLVDSLDYESELGVVLGRDVKGVKAEDAGEYIFGYTIINDVSARNLQTRHKQWYLGKGLDGFTPMGPCIVTPDELGNPADLKICSRVNGELRQCSNTKFMIRTPEKAIAELSAGMTLKAGTILATGTPAGVGMGFTPPRFLKHGDVVVCEIEKIGTLTNPVD